MCDFEMVKEKFAKKLFIVREKVIKMSDKKYKHVLNL